MHALSELTLLILIGAFLAFTGAYGTATDPPLLRFAFWLSVVGLGGLLGSGISRFVARWLQHEWRRVLATSVLMTPPVAALVFAAMIAVLGHRHHLQSPIWLPLLGQVFVISFVVMALRATIWRVPQTIIETRTVIAPPLPDAEARFLSRLSAKRRTARLIAIEAHDHYVRVHTDAGAELISLRFSDALAELAEADGFRTHRSWWVARTAVKAALWRRGTGELDLEGGLSVPVSRACAPALRRAGWF